MVDDAGLVGKELGSGFLKVRDIAHKLLGHSGRGSRRGSRDSVDFGQVLEELVPLRDLKGKTICDLRVTLRAGHVSYLEGRGKDTKVLLGGLNMHALSGPLQQRLVEAAERSHARAGESSDNEGGASPGGEPHAPKSATTSELAVLTQTLDGPVKEVGMLGALNPRHIQVIVQHSARGGERWVLEIWEEAEFQKPATSRNSRKMREIPVLQITGMRPDSSRETNFALTYRDHEQNKRELIFATVDRNRETWCEAFRVFITMLRKKAMEVKAAKEERGTRAPGVGGPHGGGLHASTSAKGAGRGSGGGGAHLGLPGFRSAGSEVARLKKEFARQDKDKDGLLTREDFFLLISRLFPDKTEGQGPREEVEVELWRQVVPHSHSGPSTGDTGGPGAKHIDLEDFLLWYETHTGGADASAASAHHRGGRD